MNRTPVKSSHVASVGWENDTLEVEFQSGDVYQYARVPRQVFDDLLRAPSVGKTLRASVYGRFSHKKVQE